MSEQLEPQYAADLHRQGEIESADAPLRPPRLWPKRVAMLAFTGALIGGAIIGVMKFANDPVSAKGSVTPGSIQASIAPTPMTPGHLSGLYIQLDYPGVFNQFAQVKTDATALEQYRLTSAASYKRIITVDVKNLPSGHLADDASYSLRALQTGTYVPSTMSVQGQTVSLMTKNDNSEVSLFWPRAGKMLIITVTTTEIGDHPLTFLNQIIPTIRWQS